ncbi:MAG: FHA domain-containing protein [Candidatus Lindowbacteria bacterium]|nr:FHA domain-containing protein [Candidatus Lindowbacteria bacterium]
MPHIKFETGPAKGSGSSISSKRVTIGRSPQNDIVVHDETVSSFHAIIVYVNRAYFLEDSNSANGTFVNGVRVQRKRLVDKDEILVGKTRLRYLDSPATEEVEEFPVKRRDSQEIVSGYTPATPSPRNVEALRQAHENLRRVYEIQGIISSIFDIKKLADKILDIIFPLFDADRGHIMLYDKVIADLQLIATKKREGAHEESGEADFSRSIAQRVLEKEESVITSNAPEDKRFSRKASILDAQIKSAMCVPIRGRKEKLGIIYVDHRGAAAHFSDEHLQLLTMVASSTGIAIDNIRLYEDNLKMNILKAVNEEMRETNRKLVELESLKEDLTNMVVHDMKNPVSNTMMALDMIAYDPVGSLTEQQADYLQMAKRNQFKLSEMITNLLEISRLESGGIQINKASMDILELINKTIDRYAAITRKEEKAIRVTVEPTARTVSSDERLLERVLSNILSNAIKHSHPKGEIRVNVAPAQRDEGVQVSVRDFGDGIPKEFHAKIFEKFCQAGLRELGHRTDTGLGLAFCKLAVETLGGAIWVESEPGKGSCFTFSLPG